MSESTTPVIPARAVRLGLAALLSCAVAQGQVQGVPGASTQAAASRGGWVCKAPPGAPLPEYTVTGLGSFGGISTVRAERINASGVVVGHGYDTSGNPRAFLWRDGVAEALPSPLLPSAVVRAHDVSDTGLVAGFVDDGGAWRAARWSGLPPVQDFVFPGTGPFALGVDDSGVMVGGGGGPWRRAVDGTMTFLPIPPGHTPGLGRAHKIEPGGWVAGYARWGSQYELTALAWDPGGAWTALPPAAGWTGSIGRDVNASPVVVGSVMNGPTDRAARWTGVGSGAPAVEVLPQLPGYDLDSTALGVNAAGDCAGWCARSLTTSPQDTRAALWRGGAVYDLNALVDPGSGWLLVTAYDVNDAGRVVGEGVNPAGQSEAYLLTPATCP